MAPIEDNKEQVNIPLTKPEVKKEEKPVVDKEKTVEILQSDLDVILGRLEKLEVRNTIKKAKVNNTDTVYVAFIDDRAVVGFGKFSLTMDQMNNEVTWMEVYLQNRDGVESVEKVNYLEFLRNAERRLATITSRNVESITEEIIDSRTGQVVEVERQEVRGFRMKGLGYSIPMVVESKKTTFDVSFEDGTTLTLNEEVVNI